MQALSDEEAMKDFQEWAAEVTTANLFYQNMMKDGKYQLCVLKTCVTCADFEKIVLVNRNSKNEFFCMRPLRIRPSLILEKEKLKKVEHLIKEKQTYLDDVHSFEILMYF